MREGKRSTNIEVIELKKYVCKGLWQLIVPTPCDAQQHNRNIFLGTKKIIRSYPLHFAQTKKIRKIDIHLTKGYTQ